MKRKNLNYVVYHNLSKLTDEEPLLELCKTVVYKRNSTILKDDKHKSRDVKECISANKYFTDEQKKQVKKIIYDLYEQKSECAK